MNTRLLSSVWAIALILLLCVGIESALLAADWGLAFPARLRRLAYDYGGFWPGLLHDWTPNYKGQPWVMFFTYGFFHGGALHLIMNMITLWSLGRVVVERVGNRGFLVIYGLSLLGGALAFGLLSSSLRPMVGASGALFGLAGAVLAWSYVDRFEQELSRWPIAQIALFLIALNLVLWWSMDGQLAWETHLGGFLTGWVAALLVDPRAVT